MQIHELTKKKNTQVDEGILDKAAGALGKGVAAVKSAGSAVAAPFQAAGDAYKQAGMDQKVGAMADKAYRAWKGYEAQLLKSDPKAKEDGTYETQLLAFVNKNLLGGMYLPNVINKDKITGLVKKISAMPVPTGGAGAFGQIAGQLGQDQTVGAQSATSTGGTATTTAAGQVHKANPNNPNLQATAAPGPTPANQIHPVNRAPTPARPTYGVKGATKAGAPTPDEQAKLQQKIAAATAKQPMNEASDPIKDLFKQLVQQCAVAQTAAPGSAPAPGKTAPQATQGSRKQGLSVDARGMAETLTQKLDPAITKSLPALGSTAGQLVGNKQVKSTGNPGADGLLIMMGFQGI
jgi:hypothetical protein